MGAYLLYVAGLVGPFFMIVYREQLGDLMGEPAWARVLGGIYSVIVYLAIIIFFWTIAEITGSTNTLFSFLLYFLGGGREVKDF